VRTLFECLGDSEEQPYIVALMNHSADLAARQAYAAWLEKREDPRAQLMRIANQLLAGIESSDERRLLASQLAEEMRREDEMWARLVLQPIRVVNCGEAVPEGPRIRFQFECPQSWGAMRPTDDEKVRFCESCSCAVMRCDTLAEAERQALLGGCIAVDGRLVGEATDRYASKMTGRPDLFALWADHLFPSR
jgi:uncharacterized protein (TIGR02996 family)